MAATFRDIQAALQKKSAFEVIEHDEEEKGLRIAGRQPRDPMNMNTANFLLVVRQLNRMGSRGEWKVDISKHHVNQGTAPDDRVVFYWRIKFQCQSDMKAQYESIVKAILSAPHTSRGEVTEFPLPGAGKDRNSSGGIMRGRGASGTK
jgi:hypothetical protein